jgi:hypothetical protein
LKHSKHVGLSEPKPRFFSNAAVFLFALICFFPNPGLPVGTNTGLQAAQIVALLSVPVVLILGLPKRQTLTVLLLILPVLLSGFLVVVTDRAVSNEVAFNSIAAMVLVLVVLLPAGRMVHGRYTVPLLSGVAWAIVLNAVVGLYQAYRFAQDKAPLVGLYQNPSFTNFIDNDPELYALYVKRPFGLFPEPSAMAASIGPWLILIAGLLLYPKLRQGMTRGTLAQLVLAVVCGVGLILMSRSGFAIWLLAGLVLVTLPYLKDRVLRLYQPGSLIVLMTLVLVGATIVALYFTLLGSRLDIQENSSWSARLTSLVWALTYLGTGLSNMLYGVGPGQSNLILLSSGPFDLPGASFGGLAVTAVWSLLLTYILESGLLGALALALVLIMILLAIVRSSARLVGFSCLAVWLAGVVFTTSYLSLLPIWLFLAVLLGWNRIFQVRATENGPGLRPGLSSVRKVVKT